MGARTDTAMWAKFQHLMIGYTERVLKYKSASLATGTQTVTITLGEGTTWIVKDVTVSVGANGNEWGADGFFQVHRTDGTPDQTEPSTTLLGETYLNASNKVTMEQNKPGTTALKIVIDHAAGAAKDVHFVVRYAYK